jgi:hypothetical protein
MTKFVNCRKFDETKIIPLPCLDTIGGAFYISLFTYLFPPLIKLISLQLMSFILSDEIEKFNRNPRVYTEIKFGKGWAARPGRGLYPRGQTLF